MSNEKSIEIKYTEYNTHREVPANLRALLAKAKTAYENSYAPYSQFHVGSAVLLANGEIVLGTNQENASFPAGICAERTALFAAATMFPDQEVVAIAIAAHSEQYMVQEPVPPCGVCRQVMAETEKRQNTPVQVLFTGEKGRVIHVVGTNNLLPFVFRLEKD
jgi:cytidine deaminase